MKLTYIIFWLVGSGLNLLIRFDVVEYDVVSVMNNLVQNFQGGLDFEI